MTPYYKSPKVIFYIGIIALVASGCSKGNNTKPSSTNTSPVITALYNTSDGTAQYPTTGMACDAKGNLYITSPSKNSIYMIAANGVVTTIAGSGSSGNSDGKGTAASFNYPASIAIDAANNIYVADAENNLIRKIAADGMVTTIAGSGKAGAANGQGKAASFSFPQGIAVDANGNIYVSDTGNDLIRKIATNGIVTTLAGKIAAGATNGIGSQATFNIPQGLALDNAGNLYVADAGNNLVRMITPTGTVSTFTGGGVNISGSSTGTYTSLNFPSALAFSPDGVLYVTNTYSNDETEITPGKNIVTTVSINAQPNFTAGYYNSVDNPYFGVGPNILAVKLPNGITIDNNYNVYIADYGNNLIRQGTAD